MQIDRRLLIASFAALNFTSCDAKPRPQTLIDDKTAKLLKAARNQIGITRIYDPAYSELKYPNGDVPRSKGVCTDVLIRAFRDAFQIDLQELVHNDMNKNFAEYPNIWGLKAPDKNIDHRRVPNLRVFFKRQGAELIVPSRYQDFKAGDLITQTIYDRPHIGIISDKLSAIGNPLLIHNVGNGTEENDFVSRFEITGRYRFGI